MSEPTELEQTITAYFLSGAANDVNIATRWWPYKELLLTIDDKFQMAVRKFGVKARSATKPAAQAFIDHMIAKGGWTSKDNEFGGTMHQFQLDAFRREVKEMQAANSILQEAAAGGETFWADKFAAVTA